MKRFLLLSILLISIKIALLHKIENLHSDLSNNINKTSELSNICLSIPKRNETNEKNLSFEEIVCNKL